MVENNYFSHTGKNGSSPGDRIEAECYHWKTYGENIAYGYSFEEAVIEGWMKSEGHCMNIMSPHVKEMGVGRYKDRWKQIFASRK